MLITLLVLNPHILKINILDNTLDFSIKVIYYYYQYHQFYWRFSFIMLETNTLKKLVAFSININRIIFLLKF